MSNNSDKSEVLETESSIKLENTQAPAERQDRRVPMTRMRARIAERLLSVTQSTAMLTTFNEVDMSALMNLRKEFQDEFMKTHNGTKLGFMGMFVKASVEALKRFPIVNASIDGTDIVYHGYQDIGVAVSTERGLVVPILRGAENLSIAEMEMGIANLALKARDSKLSIEEMSGGTFTITNGGIYGSLLSTPINHIKDRLLFSLSEKICFALKPFFEGKQPTSKAPVLPALVCKTLKPFQSFLITPKTSANSLNSWSNA